MQSPWENNLNEEQLRSARKRTAFMGIQWSELVHDPNEHQMGAIIDLTKNNDIVVCYSLLDPFSIEFCKLLCACYAATVEDKWASFIDVDNFYKELPDLNDDKYIRRKYIRSDVMVIRNAISLLALGNSENLVNRYMLNILSAATTHKRKLVILAHGIKPKSQAFPKIVIEGFMKFSGLTPKIGSYIMRGEDEE